MNRSAGDPPSRQLRAAYDEHTITVYQAFSPAIADAALATGGFVPPFRRDRMTWIKPSFLWMAYRSGWGTKPDQERVLAIDITRDGFEWALGNASLSQFEPESYTDRQAWAAAKAASPVRIQWDPERDLDLARLDHRTIQVGLSGPAVDHYVDRWTVAITDVTDVMTAVNGHVRAGRPDAAGELLPNERPYPLEPRLAAAIGCR